MTDARALAFLKIATRNNLLTTEQAGKLLRSLEERHEIGVRVTPGQLGLEQGMLTAEQVKTVEKILRSTLPPERVGGFDILEKIGQGAVGTVYRAKQVSLDKLVAVKVLHQNLSKHPKHLQQFIHEAKTAARLNHPNVVQAIDAGVDGDYHFLAMELVEGETLRDLLKRETTIAEPRCIEIALAVLAGLEQAHRANLLHRDLKPDNILLGKTGSVKLGDFGLALPLEDAELLMEEHKRHGTPYYLSPEQAQGKEIDERSDLYSLGATLYHALLGRPLFTGATVKEILTKQVYQDPVPLREAGARVSERLEQVVMQLLAKDPAKRFQNVRDLVLELESARVAPKPGELDLSLPPIAPKGTAPVRGASPSRARGTATATQGRALGVTQGRVPTSGTARGATRVAAQAAPHLAPIGGKKPKTFTIVGAALGAVTGVMLFLMALNTHRQHESDITPDEGFDLYVKERDAKETVERLRLWREGERTVPDRKVEESLKRWEIKPGTDLRVPLDGIRVALDSNPTAPTSFLLVERLRSLKSQVTTQEEGKANIGVFDEVENLIAAGKLSEALAKLDKRHEWPEELRRDRTVIDRANQRAKEVVEQLERRYDSDMALAAKLRVEKKYDEAIALMDGIGVYGMDQMLNNAEKLRRDLVEEQTAFVEEQRAKHAKEAAERYQAMAAEYAALCTARNFKACLDKVAELDARVEDPAVKRSLADDKRALELLEGFMQRFLDVLDGSRESKRSFTFRLVDKTKYTAPIDKIEPGTIWIRLEKDGGVASLPIDVQKLTDASIFSILADALGEKKPDYLIPMGVLHAYRDQFDVAREFFTQAAAGGGDVSAWVELLNARQGAKSG